MSRQGNARIEEGLLDIPGENLTVSVVCEVGGGAPRPAVSWWRDGVLVDDKMEERKGAIISNEVEISVGRDDQGSVLTCKASNNNISAPVQSSVRLSIRGEITDTHYPGNHLLYFTVLPTLVEIIGPEPDIRENHSTTFECLVRGGHPRPRISWLKGDMSYRQSLQYVRT